MNKENIKLKKGVVIWFFGLSGAGKSTLSEILNKKLLDNNIITRRLDGDIVRKNLNSDLGFKNEEREENIRRVSEVSKLFSEIGIVTICSFITPTNYLRNLAKNIIGEKLFIDIYVDCSINHCIKRDVKGLYQKALNKEISNFTGIDSVFEKPEICSLSINTENQTLEESMNNLIKYLKKHRFPNL